jgi:hypothetical protein
MYHIFCFDDRQQRKPAGLFAIAVTRIIRHKYKCTRARARNGDDDDDDDDDAHM